MGRNRTIWLLRGDEDLAAVRVGSPKKDECGQTPWLFVDGRWKGDLVWVEPWKMFNSGEKRVVEMPLSPGGEKSA